jgi:glycosyltransferase involved in cell wall biosynthesis/SAM-dependent methyltransferase
MRFHILGIPHTVSSKEYNACAYTQKIVKFGKMMKARGHEIIHYGHEDSDLICDEHVSVLTNKDFKISYGSHDWRKTFFKFDLNDHAYQTFFKNAIREVGKRKQKNDFILPFWGAGVRPICDAHNDLICVEPGIGYAGGHWARWKIFESYAIYHAYCGIESVGTCKQDWYETVIPNYFDLDDFEYSDQKEDYFLYLGRVYDGKGVNVAIQATEKAGVKLVIAGQKEKGYKLPSHVEYVGYADVETRKKLMSKAKASFLASMYVEPFGGVQIENLLSGTPTITTDWGSFVENNIHSITGYRCRTMADFTHAIKNIYKINPKNCRAWGENFSLEKVGGMYEKYFQDVLNVYTNQGWYESCDVTCLDALEKRYPSHPTLCNFDNIMVEELPLAKNLALYIKQEYGDKKIIDVGCGPGIYVNEMRSHYLDAIGLDIDDRLPQKDYLFKQSLFDTKEKADVVICLEVAEHISSELNEQIVDSISNILQPGGILIWTAAQPGQGGDGHINCQDREYWKKLFSKKLILDDDKTKELLTFVKKGPYMGWFLNNLIVFKKQ